MVLTSFQELIYKIDNSINEGYALTIEYADREYLNIFLYSSLSGSTYIDLPEN